MMKISLRNRYGIILSCAFLLAVPAFARESTDVVVMKNGDRLTGEIKDLNAGVLYMSMQNHSRSAQIGRHFRCRRLQHASTSHDRPSTGLSGLLLN
jgi:hypothetical protein